jgi:hypothetical protein
MRPYRLPSPYQACVSKIRQPVTGALVTILYFRESGKNSTDYSKSIDFDVFEDLLTAFSQSQIGNRKSQIPSLGARESLSRSDILTVAAALHATER